MWMTAQRIKRGAVAMLPSRKSLEHSVSIESLRVQRERYVLPQWPLSDRGVGICYDIDEQLGVLGQRVK
jgi:hypothetical protein